MAVIKETLNRDCAYFDTPSSLAPYGWLPAISNSNGLKLEQQS